MDSTPDGAAIVISLVVAAALAAVFLPITTRLHRSRRTGARRQAFGSGVEA